MCSWVQTQPLRGGPPLSIPGDPYSVVVLLRGYSEPQGTGGAQKADGSVTLVLPKVWEPRVARGEAPSGTDTQTALEQAGSGPVLVDTGGPWARDALLAALAAHGVTPDAVTLVVGTHGHSDHVGSLGLFPRAALLVSHDFCLPGGLYLPHALSESCPLRLGPGLEVWATPGHAGLGDVSVVVSGTASGTVVVAGDVFEREDDGDTWRQLSENPAAQERSRQRVLAAADVVVPGHGGPFRVLREPGVRTVN
ncbi:metallo-beta-lactamase domain-containing protein 1 [Dromiciops gliroides]|uniref:metallo-beta-lactamase domain-containing protein 1 n=1 Tax=Dromiciops gliroides TaxID=33562 RepID=UPI001CC6DE97|nr:metallo-beta-lactamase domain-containing protein 1 [Dromiciops gliroides]